MKSKFLIKPLFILILTFCYSVTFAQVIKGKITDANTQEAIPFANIIITETNIGTASDIDGYYRLENLTPGLTSFTFSCLGYETKRMDEVEVFRNKDVELNIQLLPSSTELQTIEIKVSPFQRSTESPLSVRNIGLNEIQRYPGGNRDISKVIQSLPGVSATVSFRNDIIIRGGSPAENKFYVDDIEVPTINHFSTQGASGGPTGLINVDLIRDVNFYSGAFPANRASGLSSLMDVSLKDGNKDKISGSFTIGASEAAVSLDGPLDKKDKATFIVSARQSYLQFLFKFIGLPFLPTYNDFQLKTRIKTSDKTDLTFVGLGSLDRFKLNEAANETETQRYLLQNLVDNGQWSYMLGGRFKYYTNKSTLSTVVSRNMLSNYADKFENNQRDDESLRKIKYRSFEAENKVRIENKHYKDKRIIEYGISYEFDKYHNQSYFRIGTPFGEDTVNYNSYLDIHQYGLFAQYSNSFMKDKLHLSAGIRANGNTYNKKMMNLLRQTSPRINLSYDVIGNVSINLSLGHYFQKPSYTTMGFRDNANRLANQNRLDYIACSHVVLGADYRTTFNAKISVEGFFKNYYHYPFLLDDSVSLANFGGNFGVIGDKAASAVSSGRSYGVEFLYQQKLYKGFYGTFAYTFFYSQFKDKNGNYVPSAWDTRHIISLTAGKKFKRNWELGLVFKASGGAPYTPYDEVASSYKVLWNIRQSGVYDYDLLNTERLAWFHQLDFRLSKKYFFKKWNLEFYLDVQNAYNFKAQAQSIIVPKTDENGDLISNASYPYRYEMKYLENKNGTIVPSVGLIIGF